VVKQFLLQPALIELVTTHMRTELENQSEAKEQELNTLSAELKKTERELARLWDLASSDEGGSLKGLASRIKEKESRQEMLQAQLGEVKKAQPLSAKEIDSLINTVREQIEGLEALLATDTAEARKVLKLLLNQQPIMCTPVQKEKSRTYRVDFSIDANSWLLPTIPNMASPRGIEPRPPP
jgi:chromosome segregation ATPase